MEARYRCVICRAFTVEIHHIVPFREHRVHEYKNLIALCPNCHSLSDDGKIDRAALRKYKAAASSSVMHEICNLLIDPDDLFDREYGPHLRTEEQRAALTIDLRERGMLAGIISNVAWPMVRCERCECLVSVDGSVTIQDNCVCSPGERLAVFCVFGCAQAYQDAMRPLLDKDATLTGEYMLQNTVQIVEMINDSA